MAKSIKLKNNIFLNGEIYKVEQVENGTVVKWANGFCLFYGSKYYYKDFGFYQRGNVYLSTDFISIDIPSGTFSETPRWFADIHYCGGRPLWLGQQGYDATKLRSGNFFIYSPVPISGIQEIQVNFMAIGKWKNFT